MLLLLFQFIDLFDVAALCATVNALKITKKMKMPEVEYGSVATYLFSFRMRFDSGEQTPVYNAPVAQSVATAWNLCLHFHG